jgi:lactoylglutathione lyase
MKFCWSTLRVKNLEESLKFYEEIIGLSVNNRFKAGPDISWGFKVDSLDDMMKVVKEKGITIESGPVQPSPHTRFFFIKDPNGMKIQLVEQM